MIKIYHPWPVPVQAACYTEPSALPEIDRWVSTLRLRGLVTEDIRFTIGHRGGVPVGVLNDRAGQHDLLPSSYLVFSRSGLAVMDHQVFVRHYREAASALIET
ncbi:MAG: hypothetical protein M3443_19660, partial [Actinomycetota bacterium]|nr:hypothetical protein [Actinomycetota bacterium]